MFQKKLLIPFFVIARRVKVITVAVRKLRLFCSSVYTNSQQFYSNVESNTTDENIDDVNGTITNVYFFSQQCTKIQKGEEEEGEEIMAVEEKKSLKAMNNSKVQIRPSH